MENNILKELKNKQKRLIENYESKSNSEYILEDLYQKTVLAAQTAVDKANATSSYDEKISDLIFGIQSIVETVLSAQRGYELAKQKHEYQLEALKELEENLNLGTNPSTN